jgi:hypothetical protein
MNALHPLSKPARSLQIGRATRQDGYNALADEPSVFRRGRTNPNMLEVTGSQVEHLLGIPAHGHYHLSATVGQDAFLREQAL